MKGKIDASVSVKIHKRTKGQQNLLTQELVIPFELKTGKMAYSKGSNEHRAQLMLYTLLMGDKMHTEIPIGLLYYSITGHLQGVLANFQEIKGTYICLGLFLMDAWPFHRLSYLYFCHSRYFTAEKRASELLAFFFFLEITKITTNAQGA